MYNMHVTPLSIRWAGWRAFTFMDLASFVSLPWIIILAHSHPSRSIRHHWIYILIYTCTCTFNEMGCTVYFNGETTQIKTNYTTHLVPTMHASFMHMMEITKFFFLTFRVYFRGARGCSPWDWFGNWLSLYYTWDYTPASNLLLFVCPLSWAKSWNKPWLSMLFSAW